MAATLSRIGHHSAAGVVDDALPDVVRRRDELGVVGRHELVEKGGEITVEEASPPPSSLMSNRAPFMEAMYPSFLFWRIRRNWCTQEGSSKVSMIIFSVP